MINPQEYENSVSKFLKAKNIKHIVAFSGGYTTNSDLAQQIISDSMKVYQGNNIAILTGGTMWNLPGDVTRIAKQYNLPTIGVLPIRGEDQMADGLDLALKIPSLYLDSEWGDESQIFAKLANGIELIGGGAGTGIEIFQSMKISLRREKKGKAPIYLAPISGFGGIEEMLYKSALVNPKFMPEKPFNNGTDAANYILDNLRK